MKPQKLNFIYLFAILLLSINNLSAQHIWETPTWTLGCPAIPPCPALTPDFPDQLQLGFRDWTITSGCNPGKVDALSFDLYIALGADYGTTPYPLSQLCIVLDFDYSTPPTPAFLTAFAKFAQDSAIVSFKPGSLFSTVGYYKGQATYPFAYCGFVIGFVDINFVPAIETALHTPGEHYVCTVTMPLAYSAVPVGVAIRPFHEIHGSFWQKLIPGWGGNDAGAFAPLSPIPLDDIACIKPGIEMDNIDSECEGATISLTALPTVTSVCPSGTPTVTFWEVTSTSPLVLGAQITAPATYTIPSIPTTLAAKATENTCDSIVTFTITPLFLPTVEVTVTGNDTAVCSNAPVDFDLTAMATASSGADLQFNTSKDFASGTMITPPTSYEVATYAKVYVRAASTSGCYTAPENIDSITLRVNPLPAVPTIVNSPLYAFYGDMVNLADAVGILPGLTYNYYENADKTGPISGSVVTFTTKNDYYVSAANTTCESETSLIEIFGCPDTTVADEEGNIYRVIPLKGLCWTENLRTTIVPGTFGTTDVEIAFAKPYTCPTCPPDLEDIFGLLYTWYSAVNVPEGSNGSVGLVQGICPAGYHIPTAAEWSRLNTVPANDLKSTDYWIVPGGTNATTFDARPAGWYNSIKDRFEDLYGYTGWWSSDQNSGTTTSSYFEIAYYCETPQIKTKVSADALSVRCVMDY